MSQIIQELRAAANAIDEVAEVREDDYAWGFAAGLRHATTTLDDAEGVERALAHLRTPSPVNVGDLREMVDRINKKNAEDTTVFPDNRDPAPSTWQDEARLGAAMAHGY